MRPPVLTHPHDLLVRRFQIAPELMADLLRYYPQLPEDQQTVNLINLKASSRADDAVAGCQHPL